MMDQLENVIKDSKMEENYAGFQLMLRGVISDTYKNAKPDVHESILKIAKFAFCCGVNETIGEFLKGKRWEMKKHEAPQLLT